MTPAEVASLIDQIPDGLTPDEFLVALANQAAEAEREACAAVCEQYPASWGRFFAWAIRAMGLK